MVVDHLDEAIYAVYLVNPQMGGDEMMIMRDLVLLISHYLHRLINKDMPLMPVFKVFYVGKHGMRSEDDFLNLVGDVLHIVG